MTPQEEIEVTETLLKEIGDVYTLSRAIALSRVVGPPSDEICQYCGRFWRKWTGSRLDGHSKCIITDAFKNYLAEIYRMHFTLTYQQVANALGVTPSVVRSWVMPISPRRLQPRSST